MQLLSKTIVNIIAIFDVTIKRIKITKTPIFKISEERSNIFD